MRSRSLTTTRAPRNPKPGKIPTVSPWKPGNLIAFRRSPLEFLTRSIERHGDLFRFHVLGIPMIMLNDPDHIEQVLVHKSDNYDKRVALYKIVKPALGKGLIANPGGEHHRHQRKIMQPTFRPSTVAQFAGIMTRETSELLDRWEPEANTGKTVNLTDDLGQVALRIVVRSLFSAHVGTSAREFELAFAEANEVLAAFFAFPFPPLTTPGRRRRKLRSSLKRMNDFISWFVEQRRSDGEDCEQDLLTMLMQATHEDTGERMTIEQLHDEVLNLVIAAFETTTNAASWAFYLLSQNPESERRFLAEVDALNGKPPGYEDLTALPYTRMVVDETLRLYSPAYQTMRRSVHEDEIGGYRIPAHANIYLNSYVTHRHPKFWDKPATFDPERFTPERSADRPKHAYTPFGSGPRICIGKYFALTELQLILATVAQRYRLVSPPDQPPMDMEPLITLHPKNGVRLLVQSR